MKRRNFTQSLIATLGISSLPLGLTMANTGKNVDLQSIESITSDDGLELTLLQQVHPTNNQDAKQFILTYEVGNNVLPLEEKIYDLTLTNGKSAQVFMTPVNDNQLQAVFNWRINA